MKLRARFLLVAVALALLVAVIPLLDGAAGPGGGAVVAGPPAAVPERSSASEGLAAPPSSPVAAARRAAPPADAAASPSRVPRSPAWRVTGTVVDPSGRPVPGALVGLATLHDDAPGHRGERATAHADARGAFALEVPPWARGARVLLLARHAGYAPFSERVVLEAAALRSARTLALEVGAALSGRVVRDGRPVANARVSVDVAYGIGGVFDLGSEAWWADGRLHEKHGGATTGEGGYFRIDGLGPYEHRVELVDDTRDVPRVGGRILAVTAPDDRTYDLTGARVAVSVLGPFGPLEGAEVHVSCAGYGVLVRSALGPTEVEVPASSEVSIGVRHPMSNGAEEKVTSPARGQVLPVDVALELVSRPSLTLHLPGATRAGVERVTARFQQPHSVVDQSFEAASTNTVDTFRLDVVPLPPEPYVLLLEPAGGDGPSFFIAPRSREVALPESGDLFVEFDLELFARVQLDVDAGTDGSWSAAYRLVDAAGNSPLDGQLSRHASFGSTEFFEVSGGFPERWGRKFRLDETPDEAARRCGVVPAGPYTLNVDADGYEPWSAAVELRAGATERIAVHLVRAGD